jgi:apolipoprotein D and lipocalin family protein
MNQRLGLLVMPLPVAVAVAVAVTVTLPLPLPLPGVHAAPQADTPSGGGVLAPVSRVDLARYAGIWYEIAKIPNRFQKQCARDTLAQYTLRPDGRIDVVNQCIKRNGSVDQARGIAKVVDTATGAKLKVSLVSLLGWRPFWGDYWIVGLDPNYRWAVVGAPNRKFGWILARSKTLDANSLETISAIIERNGYQRGSFQMDGQGP